MKNLVCFLFLAISFKLFAANSSSFNFPVDCDEKNLELRFTWIQKAEEDFFERSWFVSFSNIENELRRSLKLKIKGGFAHSKLGPSFEVLLSDNAKALLNGLAELNNMQENQFEEYIRLKKIDGALSAHVVGVDDGIFQISLDNLKKVEFIAE